MSILFFSTIIIFLILKTFCFTPTHTISDLISNPLGISSKQDFIPVILGISEKFPNTRIMFYIDINNDKMYFYFLKLGLI